MSSDVKNSGLIVLILATGIPSPGYVTIAVCTNAESKFF